MSSPSPETYQEYQSTLDQVLQDHSPLNALPHWRSEADLSEGLTQRFLNWLEHLFPKKHSSLPIPSHLDSSFSMPSLDFWRVLLIVLILSMGVFIIYLILKRRKSFRSQVIKQTSHRSEKRSALPEDIFKGHLQEALAHQDFHKACRLRWKLFLLNLKEDLSFTPLQFSKKKGWKGVDVREAETLEIRQNEWMFGKCRIELQQYLGLDIILGRIECEEKRLLQV